MKWSEPESPGGWSSCDRVTHYADDYLGVVTERVTSPQKPLGKRWTTVQRKQAVVIAAMTQEGKLVLVCQERIPVRQTIWEMPAGQVDEETADTAEIEKTALRELEEETGYRLSEDGRLRNLGIFFASPGFTDEREHLFLARPVIRDDSVTRDCEESIVDCREFNPMELRDMIARGEIRDANTLSMFARLVAMSLISFGRGTE